MNIWPVIVDELEPDVEQGDADAEEKDEESDCSPQSSGR